METQARGRVAPESGDVLRSAVSLAADLTRHRDVDTGLHLERVRRYACLIAEVLPAAQERNGEFLEGLSILAPAHDVGKLAIPDSILLKQGALDFGELEIMRRHVAAGVAVIEELVRDFDLEGSPLVPMLRNIVRSHHEAMDGSGYPEGLKGEEIPLEARIVTVADVFDALTSDRPYKRVWTARDAMRFLAAGKGKRFDPECVEALESRAADVEAVLRRFSEPGIP